MTEQSICAVIVTYHPSASVLENLHAILAQVKAVVVVDNGSNAGELVPLRAASEAFGFHLIENGANLGIADALNQGVRWAKSNSYPWVILFDQDSTITDGFIGQMFAAWECHTQRGRVGSIHPRYVDPESGIEPVVRRASDGGPWTSMTSGAMMPTWIFDEIGRFASEFVIDMVDCEYSLRIRAAGYLIADSRQAVLLHRAGEPKMFSLLGFRFRPSYHSTTRRYYISRNRVVVYLRYFRVFPRWVLQSLYYDFLRETLKCFIVEPGRAHKFRNFLLGTWDGLTGRMGIREGL
jgi:rhamnosyltransferase